jgi:hypothetical protein
LLGAAWESVPGGQAHDGQSQRRSDVHAHAVLASVLQVANPRCAGRIHALDDHAGSQCCAGECLCEPAVGKRHGTAMETSRTATGLGDVQITNGNSASSLVLEPPDDIARNIPNLPPGLVPRRLTQVLELEDLPSSELPLPVGYDHRKAVQVEIHPADSGTPSGYLFPYGALAVCYGLLQGDGRSVLSWGQAEQADAVLTYPCCTSLSCIAQ